MNILLTHIDLDGIGCYILSEYFNLQIDIIKFIDYKLFTEESEKEDYNELLEECLGANNIYFTDISPSEEMLKFLKDNKKKFYIFDHHEKADYVKKEKNTYFNINKCGTLLFFEFLSKGKRVPSIVYDFVNLINVYDLWLKDSSQRNRAENLNRLFYKEICWFENGVGKYKKFCRNQLRKLESSKNKYYFNVREIRLLKDSIEKEKEGFIKAKKTLQSRIDVKNKKYGLFKSKSKISMYCDLLLEENPDYDYIICINEYEKGKVSIRSRSEDFNTNMLEGIGGHKLAGGGFYEKDFLEDLYLGKIKSLNYVEDEVNN